MSPQTGKRWQVDSRWRTLAVAIGIALSLSWGIRAIHELDQDHAVAQVLQEHPVLPGDVVLYTTSTCPYCAKARAWLSQHRIPYQDCNIETDAACEQVYAAQGAPGVPLMRIKGRWHLGFDADWFLLALQTQSASPKASTSPRP